MGCRFVVGKAKTRRLSSLLLVLALSGGVVLVWGNHRRDGAQVKEALRTLQASKEFSQKRVNPPGEVMCALKNHHHCWGVHEVTKSQKKRLAQGGVP